MNASSAWKPVAANSATRSATAAATAMSSNTAPARRTLLGHALVIHEREPAAARRRVFGEIAHAGHVQALDPQPVVGGEGRVFDDLQVGQEPGVAGERPARPAEDDEVRRAGEHIGAVALAVTRHLLPGQTDALDAAARDRPVVEAEHIDITL